MHVGIQRPLLGVFSSIIATYAGVEAMSIAGLFIFLVPDIKTYIWVCLVKNE
jgi:hypothetical protein